MSWVGSNKYFHHRYIFTEWKMSKKMKWFNHIILTFVRLKCALLFVTYRNHVSVWKARVVSHIVKQGHFIGRGTSRHTHAPTLIIDFKRLLPRSSKSVKNVLVESGEDLPPLAVVDGRSISGGSKMSYITPFDSSSLYNTFTNLKKSFWWWKLKTIQVS